MAILFNGINQGLTTGTTSLAQNVTQCTVMAWINAQSLPPVSGGIIQININLSATASRINLLLLSNGSIRIGGRTDDTTNPISSSDSTTTITTGTWYHVVGMLDYANSIGYVYINGVQSTTTGTITFAGQITNNTSSYACNLGSDENNTAEWCNIIIEDARVYHRLLSASEIQTIYACRGTDSIKQDLQLRWLLTGPEGESIGSIDTISVANVNNTYYSSSSSSITLAYTAATGNNLVLVVATTAESTNSSRIIPTTVTFNGNNLAIVESTYTTTYPYNGVSIWSKTVTSGESGNIVITWSGSNSRKTLFAYTLINAQNVVENSDATYNNYGVITTGLTTLSPNDLVVTACANEDGYAMTALGANHIVDSTVVSGAHAGAIGHVSLTVPTTISGIGFTSSPTPGGEALAIAAFKASNTIVQLTELSNNEYVATALNVPIYTTSYIKPRRTLCGQG
jgi:hypothetical protein